MIDLVCSECGGNALFDFTKGIDNWPMAKCRGHAKPKLVALMSTRAWQHKKKTRHVSAEPEDVFGALSDEDKRRLAQQVKLL